MAVEIRTVADAELGDYLETLLGVFGHDAGDADPTGTDRLRAIVDPDQIWAAFDGRVIVGTAASFQLTIVLPGGATLPMAGLTMVTVRPTHRRRGILRSLIETHLHDARARGYAVSGLWASEAAIYGRFGYGLAAEGDAVTIERSQLVGMPDAADAEHALEPVDEATARERLPPIYARAIAARPGALLRSDVWWRERRFLETGFVRGGASRRRHVLARRGDELVGYLVYRQRPAFADGSATGKVEIVELVGCDGRAEAALWRFALTIDLFPTVTWWNAPVDDVLPWLVADPRRILRRRMDTLFLRIDDPARVLAARRYDVDGTLVLDVDGTAVELVVEHGEARCASSGRTPELVVSRAALGSLYLGAVSATRLARAGQVHGDPAAIARADRMLASAIAPWCPEVF